uniref:PAXX non-homologous end joining factor n=1 Tax=Neovison vison TaxID=452646 RepID=A0A8C7B603_NEOVI
CASCGPSLCGLPRPRSPVLPRTAPSCPGQSSNGSNCYRDVTDAAELWSTCFTADSLAALKARFGLSAAEDITSRFRAACEQRALTFVLQEDRASLTLSGEPSALDFALSKVPGPEAASRLQALTLRLADQVCTLRRQLAGAVGGCAQSLHWDPPPVLFPSDVDAQRGGPGLGVRRRCPGESLINPGFKSKKPAGGVDFESP